MKGSAAVLALVIGVGAPIGALAADAGPHGPVHTELVGFFTGEVAIGGYDPVAYFEQNAAVKGESQFKAKWNDATWYFSSEKNRDAFLASPTRYAPQYGGYCALAMASGEGKLAPGSGKSWTLHDGKLYLNYDNKVMARWRRDIPANVHQADANWPRFTNAR